MEAEAGIGPLAINRQPLRGLGGIASSPLDQAVAPASFACQNSFVRFNRDRIATICESWLLLRISQTFV